MHSEKMQLKAYAKINLTLNVLKRLPSGYHEIESVMHRVDLHDVVSVRKISNGIKIKCDNSLVPTDEKNAAYKAAELLIKRCDIRSGVEITIEKKIPIAAGLSGGSTDAGTVLIMINKMFNLNLSKQEIMMAASEIGMDVPFSILGGAAIAKGRGEVLEQVKGADFEVLIVNPGILVSTKESYENLNLSECGQKVNTSKMVEGLRENNAIKIAENLHNDFEHSVIKKHPIIGKIKQELILAGALNSIMSGSGSTVFGVFEKGGAENALSKLREKYPFVYLSKTIL